MIWVLIPPFVNMGKCIYLLSGHGGTPFPVPFPLTFSGAISCRAIEGGVASDSVLGQGARVPALALMTGSHLMTPAPFPTSTR